MLKCTEWTKSKHVNIGDQQNRTKLRLLAHSLKKKKIIFMLCCNAGNDADIWAWRFFSPQDEYSTFKLIIHTEYVGSCHLVPI